MAVQHRRLSLPFDGARVFLATRFPLQVYGPAILFSYYCLWWLFDSAAGAGLRFGSSLPGAISFVLLFLQARLIDDIEDQAPGAGRGGLMLGLALAAVATMVLNWGRPSLGVALAALAAMLFAPLVMKPLLAQGGRQPLTTGSPRRDALLFLAFEGAQLLTFFYVYAFWRSQARPALPPLTVASTIGLFWTVYLFWKYARAVVRPDWRPFGLSWNRFRPLLIGTLLLCLIFQLTTAVALGLSGLYGVYAVCLTLGFAIWLRQIAPRFVGGQARALIGLLFVTGVNLGLIIALALRSVEAQ